MVFHIPGLFCQDPDTGKLHPINSTWPSESFCGNYTCKLRQKNVTQTEYSPVAKINITELAKKDLNDMDTSPSEQAYVVIKKVQPVTQSTIHKEAIDIINSIKDDYKAGSDTDRYLTEDEIKAISEILHTVKKSDLEAIVEIYNMAQDIYKELENEEKVTKGTINTNTQTQLKTETADDSNVKKIVGTKTKESVSYWYEPLYEVNTKVKPADLKIDASNPVPTARAYSHPATYFEGMLTDRDFRKLPYYYPMSSFQRMSSYVYTPRTMQDNVPRLAKPCSRNLNNIAPTWINHHTSNIKPETVKRQTAQPMLLPYPFAYVNNFTYPPSYDSNYPWAQLNSYSQLRQFPQHYIGAYVYPNNANSVSNAEGKEEKPDVFMENTDSMNKAEESSLPEWQTEELSDKVLEEVKANVLEDSKLLKPLNLAKNIILEKVGKVIKLDELTRTKRDTNNIDIVKTNIENESDQYEPYIEKIM